MATNTCGCAKADGIIIQCALHRQLEMTENDNLRALVEKQRISISELEEENAQMRGTLSRSKTDRERILETALERIVAMDAVTDDERAHYWTDRAERMRDSAMIALRGENVAPLSQLLETARRGLSYIQHRAEDLDDAKRAAEHALKYMSFPGNRTEERDVDQTQCRHEASERHGFNDFKCGKCGAMYQSGK